MNHGLLEIDSFKHRDRRGFRDVPVPEFLEINGVGDNTCPKRCQERKIPVTRYWYREKEKSMKCKYMKTLSG